MHRVAAVGVHLHALELRRGERLRHVVLHVGVPAHDVDLLAVQLANDVAHARALQANAGAHGVHLLVQRAHRKLRAVARIARDAHDFNHAVGDFTDFKAEQGAHELGRGAAERHGRTLRVRLHGLHAVHDGADGVAHRVLELGVDVGLRNLADLAHDDLARGLRGDAPEARGRHLDLDLLAQLGVRLDATRARKGDEARALLIVGHHRRVVHVEGKVAPVDDHAQVLCNVGIVLGGLLDGFLNGGQYVFALHTALALDVGYNRRQFVVYGHLVAPILSKNNNPPSVIPLNHRERSRYYRIAGDLSITNRNLSF